MVGGAFQSLADAHKRAELLGTAVRRDAGGFLMRQPQFSPLTVRVREVRREIYGKRGAPILARDLGLPARTWMNYESGVMIPATVILRFIDLTGVNAHWLLTGQGDPMPRLRAGRTTRRVQPPPWAAGA
jgi:hypothetical protein